MKKVIYTLAFLILSVSLTSCGSVKNLNSPDTVIKNVVNKSNKNSNYIKANEWMVNTFNNAESVIQFTDKEAGIVKGKYLMKSGAMRASGLATQTLSFTATITIRVKENACRLEISPPSGMFTYKMYGVEYGFTPEMFRISAAALTLDFEKAMLAKSENDNW